MTRGVESLQATMRGADAALVCRDFQLGGSGFSCPACWESFWCLAFYPWFRDDPAQKKSVSAAELRHIEEGRGNVETGHRMEGHVWRELFSSPSLWAMALYYICGSFGWSFFVSWMPRYMKEVHGVTFEKSEWS